MAERTGRFRPHPNGPRLGSLVLGSTLVAAGVAGMIADIGPAERATALAIGAAAGAVVAFAGIVWRLRRLLRTQ